MSLDGFTARPNVRDEEPMAASVCTHGCSKAQMAMSTSAREQWMRPLAPRSSDGWKDSGSVVLHYGVGDGWT